MKYRQLTKEQFEGLHEEFAHFLATQSIDAKEWTQIKKEKPTVAEDEMNVFERICDSSMFISIIAIIVVLQILAV